jgi:predicted enzyme related to lactoylglutathione lyase
MTPQMNPVNWFEIPATDIDRAAAFYSAVFSVDLKKVEMGNSIMAWLPANESATGAAGTLIQEPSYTPSHNGTVVYFSVEDIDKILSLVESHGGKTLVQKTVIGEHGVIAMFEDSEGNRIGLHSTV